MKTDPVETLMAAYRSAGAATADHFFKRATADGIPSRADFEAMWKETVDAMTEQVSDIFAENGVDRYPDLCQSLMTATHESFVERYQIRCLESGVAGHA